MKLNFLVNGDDASLDLSKLTLQVNNDTLVLPENEIKPVTRVYYKFSELCNMTCDYCFQIDNSYYYDKDVILKNLELAIEYFKDVKHEKILYGGEPFLKNNLLFIKKLFNELPNDYIVFTNGAFDEESKDFIIENAVNFNGLIITLDGPEELHNKRRNYTKGNGFKVILNNIKELSNLNFKIIIQMNIDSRNYHTVDTLINFLDNFFNLENENITFVLKRVVGNNYEISDYDLIRTGINLIYKYKHIDITINSVPLQKIENLLLGNGITKRRCNIGHDIIVDMSKAILYTCNQNSSTKIGSIGKGIDISEKNLDIYKLIGKKQDNVICKNCFLANFCTYGCIQNFDKSDIDGFKCANKTIESLQLILDNFDLFFDLEY